MTNKALIVGISEYAPLAQNLDSSLIEAQQWQELLVRRYGFAETQIRTLQNARATKTGILDRLTWLLGDAEAGDRLVFVFCGHGIRGQRRNAEGNTLDRQDEALLPFPAGAHDRLDAAIFDDELTELYGSMSLPRGTLPTLVLNCCYSAGIDFCEHHGARNSVPTHFGAGFSGRAMTNVLRFGLGIAGDRFSIRPVILAATHDSDVAIETMESGQPRSLFSLCTLKALHADPTLTYARLVERIRSSMQYASQEPCLRGDPQRMQNPFLQ